MDNLLRSATARVEIYVADVNDNRPEFEYDMYNITVLENLPRGFNVLQVTAIDADKGPNAEFNYTLEDPSGGFQIDEKTGWISVRDPTKLDRETRSKIVMKVSAIERKPFSKDHSTTSVEINLLDANDNPPAFDKSVYTLELPEGLPLGTILPPFFKVKDIDAGSNGKIVGFFLNATDEALNTFKIDNVTGTLSLIAPLDYEAKKTYDFQIIAIDGGTPPILGRAHVHIQVLDENDWTPTFANETFIMNVTEGPTSVGKRIRLPVVDFDDGPNRQMEVYIIDGNEGGEFKLDVDEGGPLLTIVSELDREKYNVRDIAVHDVFIAAKDRGVPPRIGRTQVSVLIHDINDTPPKFEKDSYYEFVSENVPVGTTIAHLQASDADSPSNTHLVYSLSKNNRKGQ